MNKAQGERLPFYLRMLLITTFFMNMGGFLVMPFLAVYLTNTLGFSPWETGTVLTVNLLCSRALPLVTGMLGDRLSHGVTLWSGVLIRGIGYFGYSMSGDFLSFAVSAAATGIGGALYGPSVSAVFAKQPEHSRKRTFTFYNQALNAGTIAGPLAGGLLVALNPVLPFATGGALFLLFALLLFAMRRHFQTERNQSRVLASLRTILADRGYLRFLGAMILFWIIFTQLNIALPMQAYQVTQDESLISAIFLCNGITGILIMFVLRKAFETRASHLLLRRGILLMSIALLAVPWLNGLSWLLLCVLFYTIGETYALPASELVVSEFSADSPNTGAYFGLFQISGAIGGTIGNYLGTWLMSLANGYLPWIVFAAIGLLMFVILLRIPAPTNREVSL